MPNRISNWILLLGHAAILGCSSDTAGPLAPDDTPLIGTRYVLTSVSDQPLPAVYYRGIGFDAWVDSAWVTLQPDSVAVVQIYRATENSGSTTSSGGTLARFSGPYSVSGDTVVMYTNGGPDTAFILPTGGLMIQFYTHGGLQPVSHGQWTFDKIGRQYNPLPSIKSVSPDTAFVGGTAFDVTVTGSGFIPGTYIQFGGHYLMSFEQSPTRLKARVPSEVLFQAGAAGIKVSNPYPGGGTSNIAVVHIIPSL